MMAIHPSVLLLLLFKGWQSVVVFNK